MYQDYCLKFDDKGTAIEVLTELVADDVRVFKYAAVDMIGKISRPTGKMLKTDEGMIPEMAPVDGWHVNVRHTEECPELEMYRVYPKNPERLWA